MKKFKFQVIAVLLFVCALPAYAQQSVVEITDIRGFVPGHTRVIMENNEVKGYFLFYQSDKVDKKTNEYTLEIRDENLAPVKNIVFNDDKNIGVLEASYNGSSIMFLFYNRKEKTLEYRAYNFEGKQTMSYVKELNNRSKMLIEQTYGTKSEEASNEALFDIEGKGYVTVYPVKEGKYYSYEVNFFFTDRKKQWTYEAAEEQEDKWASAIYLGNSDSLVLFEVVKQKTLMSGKPHSWLLALNMYTGKKAFEVSTETEPDYKFYPMNISAINGKKDFVLMGTYYEKTDKIMKDKSLGLGAWVMDDKGKIISKKYNSWDTHIGKYLSSDKKGRVENIGYIFFHKILQTENGDFFAIGEGYQKVADGVGIAMNALSMLGGGRGGTSNMTKIKVTDMVLMQFNDKFEIKNATIYDKFNNSVSLPLGSDYASPHTMALMVKSYNAFDYDFTKTNKDRTMFVTAYSDYEKTKEYKGRTFNTITFADNKITTDKMNLTSKAKFMLLFPAKTGSIMIMEYFKKEKKITMRLEKMN